MRRSGENRKIESSPAACKECGLAGTWSKFGGLELRVWSGMKCFLQMFKLQKYTDFLNCTCADLLMSSCIRVACTRLPRKEKLVYLTSLQKQFPDAVYVLTTNIHTETQTLAIGWA